VSITCEGNLDVDPAEWLRQHFEHGWCAECGRDHRNHVAIPFIGNWFARCSLEPVIDGEDALVMNPERLPDS